MSAIDFGNDNANKVKEQVVSVLNAIKDNPQSAEQKIQETVTLLQKQLQQQTQHMTKTADRQTTRAYQEPQTQNSDFPNFYSGGDWTVKDFYQQSP